MVIMKYEEKRDDSERDGEPRRKSEVRQDDERRNKRLSKPDSEAAKEKKKGGLMNRYEIEEEEWLDRQPMTIAQKAALIALAGLCLMTAYIGIAALWQL